MQATFADTLTAAESKRHIPHRFHVPDGASRIVITHRYDPQRSQGRSHLLTLTLFDPNGFRGAGHRGGGEQEVKIGATGATPGYLPGLLPPGEWTLQVDTHMVLPGQEVTYQIDVRIETGDLTQVTSVPAPSFDRVLNPEPGWYWGDLHAHSLHSDAAWSAAELVAAAGEKDLDFVTLTDHNTISSLPEIAELASADLLTMGGIELTTFWGHAVCLGVSEWIDWRVDRQGVDMNQIAERLYADDGLLIMAHPKDAGDPLCTGCRWLYPQMMPGSACIVEVWNGGWNIPGRSSRKNEDGLSQWYRWLNEGHRLVATAGSDAHGPGHYAASPGFNVIYAEQLSQRALLAGIAAGRLYLSSGPSITFSAENEIGLCVGMGETLSGEEGGEVRLRFGWRGGAEMTAIRLICGGEVIDMRWRGAEGEESWTLTSGAGWVVVEVRDERGVMLALTNPIYLFRE